MGIAWHKWDLHVASLRICPRNGPTKFEWECFGSKFHILLFIVSYLIVPLNLCGHKRACDAKVDIWKVVKISFIWLERVA